jgi:DNA-directed RNA polymerase subunit omega
MAKRPRSISSSDILNRVETLISGTDNRYRITVEVAKRAKLSRRHSKDNHLDDDDDFLPKPVLRAIIELSDKMTQPQVLSD